MDSRISRSAALRLCGSATTTHPQLASLHIAVPAELAAAVQRHHAALTRLAANLAADELPQGVTAQSIADIIDHYRSDLAASILSYQERYHGR